MKNIFWCLGLVFLWMNCTNDYQEPLIIYNVETDFRVSLKEGLRDTRKDLLFEIYTTLASFSCVNAEIVTQSSVLGNEIIVNIEDVVVPSNCTTNGDYPATTTLNLGELKVGNYNIVFSVGETIFNQGTLKVTENDYSLLFENDLNGLEFEELQLMKIPDGTIWGRIKYNGVDHDFLDSLQIQMQLYNASLITLPEGNYTNFSIDKDGNWTWALENEFNHFNSFAYNYYGDALHEIGYVIDFFNDSYGFVYDLEVDAFTYTGEEY